jgi:uncharacterized protein YndB with AHSA1/START domain
MKKTNFIAEQSIEINATQSAVWDALIDPSKIKQYLFGTEVHSEWKIGSSITYKGEWQGTKYEDKGIIKNLIPEKLLESTYWSSMSGLPDLPENYNNVIYKLRSENKKTVLTVIQDNNLSEEAKNQSEQNWKMVLEGLKKIVETE